MALPSGGFGSDPIFSGGSPSTSTEGFSFNPQPLVLLGQPIGGGLNFTAQNAVAQVDQASQAYSFIKDVNSAAYGFLSGTFGQTFSFATGILQPITGYLGNIGGKEASAMDTAAKNL